MFSAASKSLQTINSLLPNLKSLTLLEFDLENIEICFKNVTKFNAKSSAFFPHKLQFPKLQSFFFFELREHEDVGVWVEFLKRHVQVTEFHLKSDNYNDADFEQLIAQLQNMIEMTFTYSGLSELFSIERGIQLLNKHKTLRRFHVICDYIICEDLRENFETTENEWIINDTFDGLSFERN